MKTLAELKTYFADDYFAMKLCGISIEEASSKFCKCRMPLTDDHMNAMKVAQGGAVFTLADIAFSVAANVETSPTVSLGGQINYVRPAAGAYLVANASLVSVTRSTCLYRVEIFNDQSALVAHATFTGFRKG